jgi:CDP-4-dehydro-6-deoxyglucose reductase
MIRVVTLLPSGHAFAAAAQETVLEAGLRAGLNLDHSCDTGSCGACRARLVTGELELVSAHDFPFSEAERAAGWFLMCRNRPATDLLVEAPEAGTAAEIPDQTIVAKVARLERLQEDVILLQVRTPRSHGLRFLAGQSAVLAFSGVEPRALPIASCPCDPLNLRFHVRRLPQDGFSAFVFARLAKGTSVTLSGPVGDFTLVEASERPLILVAWEAGFAPIASLVDHAIQLDPEREIHLYWLSAIPRGHYLSNYCRAWEDALDHFVYHSIDLQPAGGWSLPGIFEDIGRRHTPLVDWDLYLALPTQAEQTVRQWLERVDLPMEQVRVTWLRQP